MDLFLFVTPKGLIPTETFVHPYIPMIFPISSKCGTLVVFPTILPSNKRPLSLPSNDYPSVHFLPTRILHSNALEAHTLHGTPPVSRACSIRGQLLFTMLELGHVHEESEAHCLFNRAHPRIPLWYYGAHHLRSAFRGFIHLENFESGSDTTCKDSLDTTYLHNGMILSTLGLSPHGIVFGLYPRRPHTNEVICPSLYTHDLPHF